MWSNDAAEVHAQDSESKSKNSATSSTVGTKGNTAGGTGGSKPGQKLNPSTLKSGWSKDAMGTSSNTKGKWVVIFDFAIDISYSILPKPSSSIMSKLKLFNSGGDHSKQDKPSGSQLPVGPHAQSTSSLAKPSSQGNPGKRLTKFLPKKNNTT